MRRRSSHHNHHHHMHHKNSPVWLSVPGYVCTYVCVYVCVHVGNYLWPVSCLVGRLIKMNHLKEKKIFSTRPAQPFKIYFKDKPPNRRALFYNPLILPIEGIINQRWVEGFLKTVESNPRDLDWHYNCLPKNHHPEEDIIHRVVTLCFSLYRTAHKKDTHTRRQRKTKKPNDDF